jgi:hypothetical protein
MTHINNLISKKNFKINKTTVTGFTTPTTSWSNLTPSQIDYTPSFNSTYVVYEYHTQMTYRDNYNQIDFKLQYGSDINNLTDITTNNEGYFISYGSETSTSARKSRLTIPINILFLIPAWVGQKTLVLQTKIKSSAYEVYLDGIVDTVTLESSDDYFNPFCSVHSI